MTQAHQAQAANSARMARVLHLQTTGVWVAKLGWEFMHLNGRCWWESHDALEHAARANGVTLSDIIVRTGN